MTLALAACQQNNNIEQSLPSDIKLTEWRVTGEITLPSAAKAASFVPNSVAPWVGQIIYINENNALWRTYASNAGAQLISSNAFKDVYGLSRIEAAGVVLAISDKGSLKAFIEVDDDGNFEPLITSESETISAAKFCTGGNPLTDKAWLVTDAGDLYAFQVSELSDTAVTLTYTPDRTKNVENCYVAENAPIVTSNITSPSYLNIKDTAKVIGMFKDTQSPVISKAGVLSSLLVTDGLSVYGTDKADLIAGTTTSFGSVYSDGIVILGDSENSRFVTVSASYIKNIAQ